MSIYRISGFDDGPHWEIAFIEADTPEAAKAILAELLPNTDGVWEQTGLDEWRVSEAESPLVFVLGAGCR